MRLLEGFSGLILGAASGSFSQSLDLGGPRVGFVWVVDAVEFDCLFQGSGFTPYLTVSGMQVEQLSPAATDGVNTTFTSTQSYTVLPGERVGVDLVVTVTSAGSAGTYRGKIRGTSERIRSNPRDSG